MKKLDPVETRIADLSRKGLSGKEIGERVGLTARQVLHIRAKLRRRGVLTEDDRALRGSGKARPHDEAVAELSRKGLTIHAIAARIGVSKWQVVAARKRLQEAGVSIDPAAEFIVQVGAYRVMGQKVARGSTPYWVERPDGRRQAFGKCVDAIAWAEERERADACRRRPCLSCRRPMLSTGAHHRLCDDCRARPEAFEDDWFAVGC